MMDELGGLVGILPIENQAFLLYFMSSQVGIDVARRIACQVPVLKTTAFGCHLSHFIFHKTHILYDLPITSTSVVMIYN